MTEWGTLAQQFGFPAAVAFFVLWRLERQLKELTVAIAELRACVQQAQRRRPRAHPKVGRGPR